METVISNEAVAVLSSGSGGVELVTISNDLGLGLVIPDS